MGGRGANYSDIKISNDRFRLYLKSINVTENEYLNDRTKNYNIGYMNFINDMVKNFEKENGRLMENNQNEFDKYIRKQVDKRKR